LISSKSKSENNSNEESKTSNGDSEEKLGKKLKKRERK